MGVFIYLNDPSPGTRLRMAPGTLTSNPYSSPGTCRSQNRGDYPIEVAAARYARQPPKLVMSRSGSNASVVQRNPST